MREISRYFSRIQKILEDANARLRSVLSDVLRKSGRAILQALIDGESDPEKLADLAQGHARKKRAELVEALRGRIRDHHRGLQRVHLDLVTALHHAVAELDATVGKSLGVDQQMIFEMIDAGLLEKAQ